MIKGVPRRPGLPALTEIRGPKYSLGRLSADLAPAVRLLLGSATSSEQPRGGRGLAVPPSRAARPRPRRWRRRGRGDAPAGIPRTAALSADADARALVSASTAVGLTVATVLLCGGVVAAALAIGVPLAWLVVRTDLPGRRFWGLAASLPLVIPSFVAALALLGASAPRGLFQQALEPLGVETVPELNGYWGALLALTLATYPYVFLLSVDHYVNTARQEQAVYDRRVTDLDLQRNFGGPDAAEVLLMSRLDGKVAVITGAGAGLGAEAAGCSPAKAARWW